ncbi:MAG: aldo/keto reductase [Planctomycetes bacterium]|nr:aldo/keto reductase [Planctomycetota bacterium]
MQTRQLGYTDLNLTTVGLGTWAMGGPWQHGWGPQDDGEAIGAILMALEKGVNWIDTAPIYGCGHSEELIAQALKQTSFKPLIATKCSLLWNEKREKINCLKKESIRKECHDSLKRLGVEVIDLYQMHWGEPDEDIEEAWEEMANLKKQGKVRHIGISNFKLEQIKRVQKIHPVASLQPLYSMFRRNIEDEFMAYCTENNIGLVTYSPMQRGLLTGKFTHEKLANLPPDDWRLQNIEFQEPRFSLILELVEKLKKIAERKAIPMSQLAISWVLRKKEVTAAIVGARSPSQIAETAGASDVELNAEDIDQIENRLAEYEEQLSLKEGKK